MLQVFHLPKNIEKEISQLLARFIWNGRKPKIRLDVLKQNKMLGGRNLTDVAYHEKSLKVQWIPRLYQGDAILTWLAYCHMNLKIRNQLLWECNFCSEDAWKMPCKNLFWKSVLVAWSEYNYNVPESSEEIVNQIIWYNSHIKIGNKLVFYQEAYNAGVLYVKDLIYQNRLMMYEEFAKRMGRS